MKLCRNERDGALVPLCGAFLFAILMCARPGFAQQRGPAAQVAAGSVTGKVTATAGQKTTDILAGITVKLTATAPGSTSKTTVTDFKGSYEFTHLAPGEYSLEAVVAGFQSWTATVTLGPAQAVTEDIALQISSVEERIEVQGEAVEVATQSVSATATVNEQQLEDLPLRTQKFTEALAMSPSVIRTQEGKLNFNGQAESQGMLLVDSAENVDPVSGSFAIPIPVNAIQNIQVFSTPDSSAYGGFSGGLTRIEIKPPGQGWNYKFLDMVPSFRGKNDHLIGLLNMTPGVEFGGPTHQEQAHLLREHDVRISQGPGARAVVALQRNDDVQPGLLHEFSMDVFSEAYVERQRECVSSDDFVCKYRFADPANRFGEYSAPGRVRRNLGRLPVRLRAGSDHARSLHEFLCQRLRPRLARHDH